MEKEIKIPDGVEVHVHGLSIKVKGKGGELHKDFSDPRYNKLIKVHSGEGVFEASTDATDRKTHAMIGTIAAHVKNMILGVTTGFRYEMKILYTHFPITVAQSGDEIHVKNFFGEKNVRTAKIYGDVAVKLEKESITIEGNNVEEVGQTAANIERACKLSKRDRRIFQDGIYLSSRKLKTGEHV